MGVPLKNSNRRLNEKGIMVNDVSFSRPIFNFSSIRFKTGFIDF